jgi:hypothetical protein
MRFRGLLTLVNESFKIQGGPSRAWPEARIFLVTTRPKFLFDSFSTTYRKFFDSPVRPHSILRLKRSPCEIHKTRKNRRRSALARNTTLCATLQASPLTSASAPRALAGAGKMPLSPRQKNQLFPPLAAILYRRAKLALPRPIFSRSML